MKKPRIELETIWELNEQNKTKAYEQRKTIWAQKKRGECIKSSLYFVKSRVVVTGTLMRSISVSLFNENWLWRIPPSILVCGVNLNVHNAEY